MTSFNHILSEMSLVLFTILAQAVIGLSLVYAPAFINGYKNYANLKSFGLALGIAMMVAFIPSFFHLNDITHIFNVLNRMGVFYANNEWHIGWMNNEILFVSLVCAFGLFALSKNFKLGVLSYANMWNFRTFLYEWSLWFHARKCTYLGF